MITHDQALRPQSLADYVGQPALVARLRILIRAAKSRGEPLGHLLLHGPPGLGKTTLAHVIAAEMGTVAHVIMGPGVEKPQDLHGLLARINPGDVVFIDEIHGLSPTVGENLYPVLEDGQMYVTIDCKTHTTPVCIDLPPFTLIGATTQPGLLEGPMRDRFGPPLALCYYEPDDLAKILRVNADKLSLDADEEALRLLASRSRGTPRIANHLLRFSRDFATVEAEDAVPRNGHTAHVTVDVAEKALALQGIDSAGLNEQDRQYLRILVGKARPVGADALAATLGVKVDTLAGVIEPYLLQKEFIERGPRGRLSTDKATAHLAATVS